MCSGPLALLCIYKRILTFALSVCFEDVLWSWWGVMDGTGGAGPLPLGVIPGETLVVLSITSI